MVQSSMMVFIADVYAPSQKAAEKRAKKLYYWKNKYEVDFVYDDSKKVIPVEVKYREHPTNADLKGY
jgi:predicted AAA+ superfamily ATPase